MIQADSAFFNVESIHGFTSTFVAICSDTSHPFEFPFRGKRPPIEKLKFIVPTLSNQDKKVAFIRLKKYGALARSSELMKICHNMNIIARTTGGDAYSLNNKNEISNNTLDNIRRDLLLNPSHKK